MRNVPDSNAAQYRINKDWTCDSCSISKTQQSTPPPPTPAPSAEQIRDDSTFNVLQFNVNGIGNKLTELGVVLERNKFKVAVIHESKLSSKSNNSCIRNYTTVRMDRSIATAARITHLHSPIDNLFQTAIITRGAV